MRQLVRHSLSTARSVSRMRSQRIRALSGSPGGRDIQAGLRGRQIGCGLSAALNTMPQERRRIGLMLALVEERAEPWKATTSMSGNQSNSAAALPISPIRARSPEPCIAASFHPGGMACSSIFKQRGVSDLAGQLLRFCRLTALGSDAPSASLFKVLGTYKVVKSLARSLLTQ